MTLGPANVMAAADTFLGNPAAYSPLECFLLFRAVAIFGMGAHDKVSNFLMSHPWLREENDYNPERYTVIAQALLFMALWRELAVEEKLLKQTTTKVVTEEQGNVSTNGGDATGSDGVLSELKVEELEKADEGIEAEGETDTKKGVVGVLPSAKVPIEKVRQETATMSALAWIKRDEFLANFVRYYDRMLERFRTDVLDSVKVDDEEIAKLRNKIESLERQEVAKRAAEEAATKAASRAMEQAVVAVTKTVETPNTAASEAEPLASKLEQPVPPSAQPNAAEKLPALPSGSSGPSGPSGSPIPTTPVLVQDRHSPPQVAPTQPRPTPTTKVPTPVLPKNPIVTVLVQPTPIPPILIPNPQSSSSTLPLTAPKSLPPASAPPVTTPPRPARPHAPRQTLKPPPTPQDTSMPTQPTTPTPPVVTPQRSEASSRAKPPIIAPSSLKWEKPYQGPNPSPSSRLPPPHPVTPGTPPVTAPVATSGAAPATTPQQPRNTHVTGNKVSHVHTPSMAAQAQVTTAKPAASTALVSVSEPAHLHASPPSRVESQVSLQSQAVRQSTAPSAHASPASNKTPVQPVRKRPGPASSTVVTAFPPFPKPAQPQQQPRQLLSGPQRLTLPQALATPKTPSSFSHYQHPMQSPIAARFPGPPAAMANPQRSNDQPVTQQNRPTSVDDLHDSTPFGSPASASNQSLLFTPNLPQSPFTPNPFILRGTGTKWTTTTTPSTPRPPPDGELQSPAYEPLSPVLVPVRARGLPSPGSHSAARKAKSGKDPKTEPAATPKNRGGRLAKNLNKKVAVHSGATMTTRRSQSIISQADEPDELSMDHELPPLQVKIEAVTPRLGDDTVGGGGSGSGVFERKPVPGITSKPLARKKSGSAASAVKRKRQDSITEPSSFLPPTHVLWTRGFSKVCSSVLDQIASHRDASMFATAVRERDAPGYKNIVLQPQDINSIRAAIKVGNKAATQAAQALPEGDPGTPSVRLPISEDLVPPRGIINSSQLKREIVHMLANAIMYNPDPDRGLGPVFERDVERRRRRDRARRLRAQRFALAASRRGRAQQREESDRDVEMDEEEDEGAEVLGYRFDADGVVRNTRSMFVEVERLLNDLRSAEVDAGAAERESVPVGTSTGAGQGAGTGTSTKLGSRAATEADDDEDELAADGDVPAAPSAVTPGTVTVAMKRRRISARG